MNQLLLTACILTTTLMAQAGDVEVLHKSEYTELGFNKIPWIRTLTPVYDTANSEETYKVFTHILDFEGKEPLTKGAGGKFTHHRGMFIGWKDTLAGEVDYDTWHMSNSIQKHVKWLESKAIGDVAWQQQQIDWCALEGKPLIREIRRIGLAHGEDNTRVYDFQSELTSLAGAIQLKGDLQHAGMQVRLAQEVAEHEQTTEYILPAAAVSGEDDKVTGGWWACCNTEVGGKRYWVIHMTHSSTCADVPVYSIRKYARFGAFWEPTLEEGKSQKYSFRIIVSEKPLDQAACQARYDDYTKTTHPEPK
ncbi:MAG: DUF6807 family protein [Candidatus Hydrogenedentes bacterium]|nr:DUF6807 family protein [Candidatus Hydrogenedentota bacterium]